MTPLGQTASRRFEETFWDNVKKDANDRGCWEWQGFRNSKGYGLAGRPRTSKGQTLVHRHSWTLANGPIPEGLGVLHRCDNPPCVNPAHLFLGTKLDNNRDRHEKGRTVIPRGVAHGMAKLSESAVIDIRTLSAFGAGVAELCSAFNLNKTTVYRILSRESWAHLP